MLQIDDKPVPPRIVKALQAIADAVPDEAVLELARHTMPELATGVRVIASNCPAMRTRLRAAIAAHRRLDPKIGALLTDWGLAREVTAVLSEEALRFGLRDFCAYFGEEPFMAALLLDARPAVRQLAHEHLGHHSEADPWAGADRAAAARALKEKFDPFLHRLADLETAPSAPAPPPPDLVRALEEAETRARQATERAARAEKQAERERTRLQRELEREQAAARQLRQDLDAARAGARASDEERRLAVRAREELEKGLEQRVGEGIAAGLDPAVRSWLAPVRKAESALAPPPAAGREDLLARARRLLERQKEIDRHSGNRAEARTRLAALEEAAGAVRDARAEAIAPLPELAGMADELEREAERVRSLLGLGEPAGELAPLLAVRANEAPSWDDLAGLRRFVDEAAALGALRGKALRLLFRKLDEAAGRLFDTFAPRPLIVRPAPLNELAALRQALAGPAPVLLMIDGHNVLHDLADLFPGAGEKGGPGQAARQRLAELVAALAAPAAGAEVRLYFDGPERSETTLSRQARVIYSGGEGEHRADRALLADLEFARGRDPAPPAFAVTADGDLARQARALGAALLHPQAFAVLLDDAREAPRG